MTRKAKGKAHKGSRKQSTQNGQDQPTPRKRMRDRLKRGVLTFLNGTMEAFTRLLAALSEWVSVRWHDLTPRGQKAVLGSLWLAGVAFGVYSAWFARKYSMPALVIRWGILRVEARFGVLMLLILLFLPLSALLERGYQWRSKQTLPHLTTPGFMYRWRDRVVPPLAQARWLYVRHQDARAQNRTQTLLAQNSNNAPARELLALIETRIARQTQARQENTQPEDAPQTPPAGLSQRSVDSNLPSIMARVVALAVLCLCLYGSVCYARVGITQGWQVIVWMGHDKSGNPTQASALATMVECCLGALIGLAYLMYGEDGIASTAAWKKFVNRRSTANKPVEKKT